MPTRIVPSRHSVQDRDGQEWSSDEYYRGGAILANERIARGGANPWDLGQRVGNFQYSIPVAVGRTYDATVVFEDPGIGRDDHRAGPDVFNVSVNGQRLLIEFSLSNGQSVTKTFTNLIPNAQGKLIFLFEPVKSYAVLNALQVGGFGLHHSLKCYSVRSSFLATSSTDRFTSSSRKIDERPL